MHSIEEEKADKDPENPLLVEDANHEIHQVVSMKKVAKPVNRRNSSFFMKKMMSFKSRAQIGVDNDDLSSEDSDADDRTDDGEEKTEGDRSGLYIDPPMPVIGQPVKIELLISRNHKAESGLKTLMQMVNRDVSEALSEVDHLPVSDEVDRVQVSHEAAVRIGKVRSTQDIERSVQQSYRDIQKCLNYRKSALIMMNSNYSRHQVRKIEPIYVNETRSIIQHKADTT